jgi:hypothetical protein
MNTSRFIVALLALTLTGCDLQQRGDFNPDELGRGTQAEVGKAKTTADTEEEPFELMSSYSEEDLNAISDFVEWNTAVDMLKKSIAKHPEQNIKTADLFGGIALFTSADSAYWYKEGTLYAANPYAEAYSPELDKAPAEIDHAAVQAAVIRGQRVVDPNTLPAEQQRKDTIQREFGEFFSLLELANKNLPNANYSADFLTALKLPVTDESTVTTVLAFANLYNTIAAEHGAAFDGLGISRSQLLYTFGKINRGMDYELVNQLLGNQAVQIEKVSRNNNTYTTVTWEDPKFGKIYGFFREGKLYNKVLSAYN